MADGRGLLVSAGDVRLPVVGGAANPAHHAMGASAAALVAVTLKALADPLRLRMLSLIATSPRGEACVGEIATVAEVSQPTVSHHLKVLKEVGVLNSQRRATWIYYSIAPPAASSRPSCRG